ncbi:hypothetical protein K1719_044169 [Acacia pycnantha]|nr:hypothetical protein K1719_044169 [Acacia pycnantha]
MPLSHNYPFVLFLFQFLNLINTGHYSLPHSFNSKSFKLHSLPLPLFSFLDRFFSLLSYCELLGIPFHFFLFFFFISNISIWSLQAHELQHHRSGYADRVIKQVRRF